ncbi:MAG: DUF4430 domain-containing protein [Planctomycetota bacterium]
MTRATDHEPNAAEPSGKPSGWASVGVLAVVLSAILLSQTVLRRDPPAQPEANTPAPPQAGDPVVTVVIDPVDTPATELDLTFTPEMTVLDALESASQSAEMTIERTGEGPNAFVHAIGDAGNEGAEGRNWQYYINGERGEVGAGVHTLAEGDRLLWKFAPQE